MSNKIKLSVKGNNIDRFIKRLNDNKIDILKIEYKKYNEINIIIYYSDYDQVLNLKTIYDIKLIEIYGIIKVRKIIKYYKYLLIFLLLGIFILILLSNVIFKIEVIHNDKNIRNYILNELGKYDIKKYHLKKNYQEIQSIKKNILNNCKNIEWIEIEEHGTKYVIRLEKRIIKENISYDKQDVVSSKSAILRKVILKNGTVIKNINDYVNKDDVVISGNVYLNDELKNTVSALGTIYGDVWYKVTTEYPLVYKETKLLNNSRNVYFIKFLNKSFGFNLNKYKDKLVTNKVIVKSNLIPLYFIKQKQQEIKKINLNLSKEEAIKKAIEESIKKIKLDSDEKIVDYKVLNCRLLDNKIVLETFFTVYENITNFKKIEGDNNVS